MQFLLEVELQQYGQVLKVSLNNVGAHGFSELLYTFSSCGGNNGSAFAGFNGNTMFLNLLLGFVMLFARFLPIIGTLAISGNLAEKKKIATTAGTLSTTNTMFVFLLIFIVLLVGALSFFPALALGPIAEFFPEYRLRRDIVMTSKTKSAFADKKMIGRAIKESFIKLNPKTQVQNPVMLLVYLSAILTTVLWIVSLFGLKDASSGYTFSIAVILWFTCVFANFAEAIAEGRGKAQADALRASKKDVEAHKIPIC